jgi:hypothetical protein
MAVAGSWRSGVLTRALMLLLLAGYASVLAFEQQPSSLGDDAAISFRYAERLADGKGLTYNDHERVYGASNPLYVLILASVHSLGVEVIPAARVVCSLCFVIAVLLAFELGARFSNIWGGLLAGVALASHWFFAYQVLGGMESGLSVVLGLAALLAVVRGREILAGLLLGIALWNKLDAGLLALATGSSWYLVHRRFPWRMLLAALLLFAPWLLFSAIYFGSIVPHAMAVKLLHRHTMGGFDHLWIARVLAADGQLLLGLLALVTVGLVRGLPAERRCAIVACFLWLVLHGMAFSAVDLGDRYPWYLTVLVPPLLVLSSSAFLAVRTALRSRPRYAVPASAVAAGVFCLVTLIGFTRGTVAEFREGHPIRDWEAFDGDRRLAGLFLRQEARPGEVVESAYGWVAYESRLPFDDGTGLNTIKRLGSPSYHVDHGSPHNRGSNPPATPHGFVRLADFDLASDLFPGFSWFTVFGAPGSTIARSGRRHLKYRLVELGRPRAYSSTHGLGRVRVDGTTLHAPPPSGAVFEIAPPALPRWLVFTPVGARVRFVVEVDGKRLYAEHVAGGERGPPRVLHLPQDPRRLSVAFITAAGPAGGDGVRWENVKLVASNTRLDRGRVEDRRLAEVWSQYNPQPSR